MIDEYVQYRSIIPFLFVNGKSREEVYIEMSSVYSNEYSLTTKMYMWFNKFSSGRTPIMNKNKPSRSIEIDTKISENLLEIV